MVALRRATEVRLWLAEQKQQVAKGDLELWRALCIGADPRLKSVTLEEFVMWVPGIGRTAARKILLKPGVIAPWRDERVPHRLVVETSLPASLRLCMEVYKLLEDRAQRAERRRCAA